MPLHNLDCFIFYDRYKQNMFVHFYSQSSLTMAPGIPSAISTIQFLLNQTYQVFTHDLYIKIAMNLFPKHKHIFIIKSYICTGFM
jgi:hypothetical protein